MFRQQHKSLLTVDPYISTDITVGVKAIGSEGGLHVGVTPGITIAEKTIDLPGVLIPITAPLVRRGGELLFLKGERVHDEIVAAKRQAAKHRLSGVEVIELGHGVVPEVTRVFRATVDAAS